MIAHDSWLCHFPHSNSFLLESQNESSPLIQGPQSWGGSFLLQGAPGGTHTPHPVLEESKKGRVSRHRWREFSPALPLKLWSVRSVLLTQCTVFFSTSLERFHPATKIVQSLNRPSLCQSPPSSWTTLLLSASLSFPSDTSRKGNCSVFVLLWLAYFTLSDYLQLHSYCCKWQDNIHFKLLNHFQVYIYTTFSLLICLPKDTGQFFYLGCCVHCSNAYETVDISWTFSFYLLWT